MNLTKPIIFLSTFVMVFGGMYVYDNHFTSPVPKTANIQNGNELPLPEATKSLSQIRNEITKQELKEFLYYLASSDMKGREPGTDGFRKAAEFMENEFKSYGATGANKGSFRQHFRDRYGANTWNVVATFPGNDPKLKDEVIVFGAHLDHLGKRGGKIYYGADDNASGSSALLELAEAVSEIKNKIKRTVLFIAFSSEERGLIGSRHYVNNPIFPLENTTAMINIDMIGHHKDRSYLSCIGAANSSNLVEILEKVDDRYSFYAKSNNSIGSGSDHVNFAKHRIPVLFAHSGARRGIYHTPYDTPDRIDFDGMTNITRFLFDVYWEIDQQEKRLDWKSRIRFSPPEWKKNENSSNAKKPKRRSYSYKPKRKFRLFDIFR